MNIFATTDLKSPIYKDSLHIRLLVFVEEQHVPLDLEVDEYEGACTHVVLYTASEKAVATARLRKVQEKIGKIERMAVLKEARLLGYGQKIMKELDKQARMLGAETLVLNAQLTALPFYETLGFTALGETFIEADMAHIAMKKELV